MEVRLRILDGPAGGMEYAIAGPLVRLGRGEDNDIVLQDGNSSRNHAELVLDREGHYVVRDLGSRNGVFVNRRKITQHRLASGDRILIGGTSIEFLRIGPGAASSGESSARLKRWAAVAAIVVVVLFGLKLVLGSGGGGGGRVSSGGSGTPDEGGGVSLGNLLSPTAPDEGGVAVGRNAVTKPTPGDAPTPKPSPVNEAKVANLVAEGDRAYGSGKLVDARASYAAAVRADPRCERCLNKLQKIEEHIRKEIDQSLTAGQSYMETRRWDAALREFEKIQLLDPDPTSINNGNATRYISEVKQRMAER